MDNPGGTRGAPKLAQHTCRWMCWTTVTMSFRCENYLQVSRNSRAPRGHSTYYLHSTAFILPESGFWILPDLLVIMSGQREAAMNRLVVFPR